MKFKRYLVLLLWLAATTFLSAQSFRAMTYNLRFNNPRDGADAWPLRKHWLAEQVLYTGPDALGVQEALHDQVSFLDSALTGYAYVGVGRDDGAKAGEYAALLYNTQTCKLLAHGTFWLSPTPEKPSKGWDAALNRVCTYALLRHKGSRKKVWVFNAHFDHIGQQAREESMKLIRRKAAEINTRNYPVVVMGDFNVEPDNPAMTTAREAWRDSWTSSETPAFGPEGTFNGFRFDQAVTRRIDYILVTPGTRVLKCAILSDSRNLRYPSDHFPVVADLKW